MYQTLRSSSVRCVLLSNLEYSGDSHGLSAAAVVTRRTKPRPAFDTDAQHEATKFALNTRQSLQGTKCERWANCNAGFKSNGTETDSSR